MARRRPDDVGLDEEVDDAEQRAGDLGERRLYVATAEGVQHYLSADHALAVHLSTDVRKDLAQAALGQPWVAQAPAVMIIAAKPAQMARKYGDRTQRYVDIEVGHAGQNILLQAVALDLGAVPVGAFDDDSVNAVLKLPDGTRPLYMIPVGAPAE